MAPPAVPRDAAPGSGAPRSPCVAPDDAGAVLDFDAVYEAHATLVWRALRRLGVPNEELDDAAQEVFLVVYRRLADFSGESSLPTWIYGISLNVARNVRRHERRHPASEPAEHSGYQAAVSPTKSAEQRLADREAHQLLCDLLDAMEPALREVFVLVELEELQMPEVSAMLGVNPNTASSRLRKARDEFSKAVARHHARRSPK